MTLVDGGSAWNLNVEGAIDRCLEQVDSDSQIVIDVILCSQGRVMEKEKSEKKEAIGNLFRAWNIKDSYSTLNNLKTLVEARPEIKFRYLSVPSKPLASGMDKLDIDKEHIWPMIEIGQQDGLDVLEQEPGYFFDQLENFKFESGKRPKI
jgi:hypothetical protein